MNKATVIGAGSFGTAMAQVLSENFARVALWGRDEALLTSLNQSHENRNYLPGLKLHEAVYGEPKVEAALEGSSIIIVATPSQATREVLGRVHDALPVGVPIVTVAKGIEVGTLCTMTEVLEQALPSRCHPQIAVLSGPSFAKEMMLRMPTVVTVAAKVEDTARAVQPMLASEWFRTYSSTDVVGVQVGGALKNVIAIAAGVADGLGLGHNTRAAIITRGLAEISRIAVKMGGNPLTLAGLAGMGDLVLTCTGELSRNRKVGIELGKGRSLDAILTEMKQVAEGVKTARSAKALSAKVGVELPICEQVYRIAYEGASPRDAVSMLMGRSHKSELV